ncbi:MAG: DUF3347 domain-containing protein [Chitinophagaceae bacterium]
MKTLFFGIAVAAVAFTSCSDNNTQSKESAEKSSDTTQTNMQVNNTEEKKSKLSKEVIASYLQLKNALANDNAKGAATAGKAISDAIQQMDDGSLTAEQKKVYDDVKEDIKEHGEHISGNGDKIAHQREHFDMLSEGTYDLIKAIGSDQTLYKDYCPMYNDGKGANWLSEVKEIRNPYLGKKMPTCGSVKEEIK